MPAGGRPRLSRSCWSGADPLRRAAIRPDPPTASAILLDPSRRGPRPVIIVRSGRLRAENRPLAGARPAVATLDRAVLRAAVALVACSDPVADRPVGAVQTALDLGPDRGAGSAHPVADVFRFAPDTVRGPSRILPERGDRIGGASGRFRRCRCRASIRRHGDGCRRRRDRPDGSRYRGPGTADQLDGWPRASRGVRRRSPADPLEGRRSGRGGALRRGGIADQLDGR